MSIFSFFFFFYRGCFLCPHSPSYTHCSVFIITIIIIILRTLLLQLLSLSLLITYNILLNAAFRVLKILHIYWNVRTRHFLITYPKSDMK